MQHVTYDILAPLADMKLGIQAVHTQKEGHFA